MFLTKKSLKKILALVVTYDVTATVFIAFWMFFRAIGETSNLLLFIGIIMFLLSFLFFFWGRYAEGKGKLVSLGLKLVRKELKPAEFIKHYDTLMNSDDLIIKKPSYDVLALLMLAYDSLGNAEKVFETIDQAIEVAKGKKKNTAKLLKVASLFTYSRVAEAEALFNEIRNQDLDIMSKSMVDMILKDERAMAIGDYKTVEAHSLNLLETSFPKPDNITKLFIHYTLGKVYEKQNEPQKAIEHYEYCANFGGETAKRETAIERLKQLKS